MRRSWTGLLSCVAEVEFRSDEFAIQRAYFEPDSVFSNRDFAIAHLHFLMTTHLHRVLTPFPVMPPDVPKAAVKAIALLGFSAYGRWAQFGSYIAQHGDVQA